MKLKSLTAKLAALLCACGFAFSAQAANVAKIGSTNYTSLQAAINAATDLPNGADVPQPTITGIRIVDGYVYVSVNGTVPYLAYGLTEGVTPDTVADQVGESKAGGISADDEITIVTPAKAGGAFFRVNRK